jgi:5-oxoprolinase (ATP-hydrolysing)
VQGQNGQSFIVEQELELTRLREDLEKLRQTHPDINSVAVVLMHSYAVPEHELSVGKLAKEMGFSQISLSH